MSQTTPSSSEKVLTQLNDILPVRNGSHVNTEEDETKRERRQTANAVSFEMLSHDQASMSHSHVIHDSSS